jgi:hypothetical protein
VYLPGCYKIAVPFADWAPDIGKWASAANGGAYNYGRFSWSICGYAAKPSGSPGPSTSPAGPSQNPPIIIVPPRPTVPPTRRP